MYTIAVAGKGGTGKTTLAGLSTIALIRSGRRPVLAIDADPNSNLNEVLGIAPPSSIVEIVDKVTLAKDSMPPGIEKSKYLEFQVREAISEQEGFDLLVMGRTEGPGCYCYANHLLREQIDKISNNYPYVVMDNEAGMEHISRRTSRNIDVMFLLAFEDKVSLKSAQRIYSMVMSMDLHIKKTYLVINEFGGKRVPDNFEFFMKPLFSMPKDDIIEKLFVEDRGLLNLSESSPALAVVEKNILPLLL